MSITPTELLEFAKTLATGPDMEAIQRAAASRAYYAAYQYYKQQQYRLPTTKARGGMHRQFISALTNHESPEISAAGIQLNQLYKLRIRADYKVSQSFTQPQALEATTLAQQLIATSE